jgi:hypothetical protein
MLLSTIIVSLTIEYPLLDWSGGFPPAQFKGRLHPFVIGVRKVLTGNVTRESQAVILKKL